jgi:transaldolase
VTRLQQLHDLHGQSPWLDNLTRGDVTGGRLRRLASQGVRGVTSNPTIIHKAISGSADYDGQLAVLAAQGLDAEASYWSLVGDDLEAARRCTGASPHPTCWSRSPPPPRACPPSARPPPRA